MNLDVVCRDFPELRLIMCHGADPWWGVAIRLMIKYPNLYMMTSAWMPRYLPAEFVHFMNTRGQDKIMWASDHPVLDMTRCLEGVDALELRPGRPGEVPVRERAARRPRRAQPAAIAGRPPSIGIGDRVPVPMRSPQRAPISSTERATLPSFISVKALFTPSSGRR